MVKASKSMYPVATDIQGLVDKLKVIAAEGSGTYEGFKSKVIEKKK